MLDPTPSQLAASTEKLRKLLDMAGHASTPPGEAINALQAARRLLEAEGKTFANLRVSAIATSPPAPYIPYSSRSLREQVTSLEAMNADLSKRLKKSERDAQRYKAKVEAARAALR